jgi:hypothetical protein
MLGLRRRTADDYEGKRWIFVSYLALENWATLGTWDRIARGLNTGIYIGYMATCRGVFSFFVCLCDPATPVILHIAFFLKFKKSEILMKGSHEPIYSTSHGLRSFRIIRARSQLSDENN